MAMGEELQEAAKNFREQLTAGIKPDIGATVILVHHEGVGLNSNVPKEHLVRVLRALADRVERGDTRLVLPVGLARA